MDGVVVIVCAVMMACFLARLAVDVFRAQLVRRLRAHARSLQASGLHESAHAVFTVALAVVLWRDREAVERELHQAMRNMLDAQRDGRAVKWREPTADLPGMPCGRDTRP